MSNVKLIWTEHTDNLESNVVDIVFHNINYKAFYYIKPSRGCVYNFDCYCEIWTDKDKTRRELLIPSSFELWVAKEKCQAHYLKYIER